MTVDRVWLRGMGARSRDARERVVDSPARLGGTTKWEGIMLPGTLEVDRHEVKCPYCGETFELFAARWCSHWPERKQSKRCPRCVRCVCGHPSYKDPRMWMDAPGAFRKRGFPRLFLLYL